MNAHTHRPAALTEGDLVGIVAPASPVREEFLVAGEERIAKLGFRVRRSPNVLARERYTAGSVSQRRDDFNAFLADPAIRAIWVARGGYGSTQLLPDLDTESLRRDPKPIIGGSDATALLLWSLAAGISCLHGPMPAQELARDRFDAAALRHHLTSRKPLGELTGGLRRLHPGRAGGTITGGCLSLVVASLGTPWEIDTTDRLLFLEDVDTKPYQLDRMLTQLRQAGKLGRVRGIVFGEMPRCVQTTDQGYSLDEVLTDLTAELSVPVVAGAPCGHTTGIHRALPFGVAASLDADSGQLRLDEPLVV